MQGGRNSIPPRDPRIGPGSTVPALGEAQPDPEASVS